jgi:hypothetical protein
MQLPIFASALLATALLATPASAQLRKFGDWIAACDNAGKCAATSLKRDSYNAYLKIARDNKSADAVVTLAIATYKPLTYRIVSDDPATSLFPDSDFKTRGIDSDGHARFVTEETGKAMNAFLRKTMKLTIVQVEPPPADPADPNIDGISLEGARAALAWFDQRQARPARPLPVIVSGRRSDAPGPAEKPPEIEKRGNATCGKEQIDAELVKTVRLGDSGLLYWFFCGQYSGAANLNHAFLLAPGSKPRAAAKPRFVLPGEVAAEIKLGAHKLVQTKTAVFNPEFDPQTLTLTSLFAGRSASDCGELVSWVWTGREFRVGEFRKMPECEGIPPGDWPVLYRADVR